MDATETQHTAADRAYEWLRDQLLARRIPDSELITEGQVADAVGVSRTPVREALLRLQAEGFVRLLPKKGALVLPVTPSEAADVIEARRLLETYAVRRAAAGGENARLVATLRAQLAAMRAAAGREDVRAYVEADRCFHAAVVAGTRNAILDGLYRSLRDRQLRLGTVTVAEQHGPGVARMHTTLVEHEEILRAIEDGNPDAAARAVGSHLDSAAGYLTQDWRRA